MRQLQHLKNSCMMIFQGLSLPNVLIGGPVITSPGFPLETCGNDGLR